jgi:hypothetical protein
MSEWESLKFVGRFAVHIVLGGLIFAFVSAFAIALHWAMTKNMDGYDGFPYARTAIEGVELLIFAGDLVCVVAFIFKETWVLLRSLLPQPTTSSVSRNPM